MTAASATKAAGITAALAVPSRIGRLKDELLATRAQFCFERARLVTESYRETEGEHIAIRRAKSVAHVFERMPIFIRPGELIVGQRAATLGGRSVYPEFHLNGLDEHTTPPEIWDFWHGRTMGDRTRACHPDALRLAEDELAAGYCTGSSSGFGHMIVDYEKVLRVGLEGIMSEAGDGLFAARADGDAEGVAFLESVLIVSRGLIRWAERYAELAEALAAQEQETGRRDELLDIARICRRVPRAPAHTLHEALQSFWFVHLALHVEQFGWSISAGRLDQYLYPYARDLLSGDRPARLEAWELLLSLWVKSMENVGTEVKQTVFQNLTLGGSDAQGRDESNELSHLCLAATAALRMVQPALSVRWHRNIDPGFWRRCLDLIALGTGMPAIFNDEVIVAALVDHGVEPDDAVGYGIVGCVEASIPGKEQGVTSGGHLNVAKALELALNDGRSLTTGRQVGPKTGPAASLSSFEEVWNAYEQQVRYLASLDVLAATLAGEEQKRSGHYPLESALLCDCIAKRRDLVFGSTRYNLPGVAIYGPTNAYDALHAIRRLVFEQGALTLEELVHALAADFEGAEPLRLMLANHAERFGNGNGAVDALANDINTVHAEFFWSHTDGRGGRFTCGVWPVEGHVGAGAKTGAGADGRRAGAPLVDGVGACQGADRSGPTSLVTSVARLNNRDHWSAGNTFNIKFSPSTIAAERGMNALCALLTTFLQSGGQQVQVNVVDAGTLRRAQERPREYDDLLVRVAGFSANFTTLSKATQDEIISRTEQAV